VFELTPDIIDQIWAEAIERYKTGEELYLKGDVAAQAYCAQQEAMEADDREGIIADYLERLLPDQWDGMDLYQRRSFLGDNEFDGGARKGSARREKVCIMEIWCECFGKERQNLKRTDSYEIEGILNRIGGWVRYTGNASGKMRISGYGIQKAFMRVSKEAPGNA
jgi:predicted P-loop ATPase